MRRPLGLCAALLIGCGAPEEPAGSDGFLPTTPTDGLEAMRLDAATTPVVGGTLLLLEGGTKVVASDVVGARLVLVDTASGAVEAELQLPEFSEPARLAQDTEGRVWVALRRGGEVIAVDPETLEPLAELPTCPAPRGLAADPDGTLWLACASGELVHFDAEGILESHLLGADLRDVVVDAVDGVLWVSRFKSAEVLEVERDGTVVDTDRMPAFTIQEFQSSTTFDATVGWRLLGDPAGGAILIHQRSSRAMIDLSGSTRGENPYGGDPTSESCGGIVHTAATRFGRNRSTQTSAVISRAPVPVDATLDVDGNLVIAAAGGREGTEAPGSIVGLTEASWDASDTCHEPRNLDLPGDQTITGVLYDAEQRLVSIAQQPFQVMVDGELVHNGGGIADQQAAYQLFHQNAGIGISCASCHPEGREDGHTWTFSDVGPRRSQNLGGGLMGTAPFHWEGEFNGLEFLVHEVFERRMGGETLNFGEIDQLGEWLDQLPSPATTPEGTAEDVALGDSLFHSAEVGCVSCHSGDSYTNNQSYDVGTGNVFQVPNLLGVGNRLPLMHDGCAETLRDRFTIGCGGGDAHGNTSQLSSAEIDALVSFLQTL